MLSGRLVNVSSTMGSLAEQCDPEIAVLRDRRARLPVVDGGAQRDTIALAKLLEDAPLKVNSIRPGFVQTELTPLSKSHAPLTAAAASEIVSDWR